MTHLKRTKAIRRLPIKRKGTKYIARASNHVKDGIPVVIAVRDIIKLARNAKEVKKMVNEGLIKINGKKVKDIKESIRLFNILEADKRYVLTVLPTGRFSFEETNSNYRLCSVSNKKMLRNKKIQLNLHDGTNLISKEKINVGDSIDIDFSGKIKKILSFSKGKDVIIISGRSIGLRGKIEDIFNGKVKIKLKEVDKGVVLDKGHAVVI